MKRVVSHQQFQVNFESAEEDSAPDPQDKITFDILGGTISFVVPPGVADEQVLHEDFIGRGAYCELTLENKAELELWLSEGPCTVVVRTPQSA